LALNNSPVFLLKYSHLELEGGMELHSSSVKH